MSCELRAKSCKLQAVKYNTLSRKESDISNKSGRTLMLNSLHFNQSIINNKKKKQNDNYNSTSKKTWLVQ